MVKRSKSIEGRTRNAFDNPLAAARSGKATTTTAPSSKKEESDLVDFSDTKKSHAPNSHDSKMNQKAEQIWHRRSGAGFHLFVDYYLGQPEGIVANKRTSSSNTTASSIDPQKEAPSGGAGLSRAALRRKKKKRKRTNDPTTATATTEETTTTTALPDNDKRAGGEQVSEKLVVPSTTTIVPQHQYESLLYRGRLLDIFSSKTKTGSKNHHRKRKQSDDDDDVEEILPEFYQFLAALSKPLPLTFPFRHYDPNEKNRKLQTIAGLRQILKSKTLARSNVNPVVFDPDHIYQALPPKVEDEHHHPWALDKASLKRMCPELKEFLNDHTRDGTIARQELGSMLPVWLLDKVGALDDAASAPRTQLRILDMCASPGSKTLQAAEQILLRPSRNGRVRANDVNANRLESLQEAVKRSGFFRDNNNEDDASYESESSPSMDKLVKYSNVDASKYPIPKSETKKYPIILCDVPCSGDGTCRKDTHVIPNWTPGISNALHSLQVKILVRAMRCCSLKGSVSYSTCSLNPIEDEAVVVAALEELKAQDDSLAFELVPVSESLLKGLVLRPGVSDWRVADFQYQRTLVDEPKQDSAADESSNDESSSDDDENDERPAQLQWYDSYKSAIEDGMEGALPSMWPAKTGNGNGDSEVPLDRCLRLFPQDQDTGGFFVAILKRTK